MTHGAAHDAAKHIAASLVRGQHAVGDEEGRRAQMIGDDAMAGLGLTLGRHAGERDRGRDQRLEQIDLVIVVGALQDGGEAFKPHAGVDGGLRQVNALICELLVLHEDEVPDFDEAVAFGVRAAGRTALHARAVIVENLGGRTARAKLAHRPEIVGARDADDLLLGEAGNLPPQPRRLVVVGIDGDQQALLVERVVLGEQLPGEQDGALLEIIAEGEVAEHLEEGVVARGVADIVEVVMLAAGAHAFLRRGDAREGRLLGAGKHVLELHHAGIGEHQGRIVARHERARGQHLMIVAREEIEEAGADGVNTRVIDTRVVDAGIARTRSLRARVFGGVIGDSLVVHTFLAGFLGGFGRAGGLGFLGARLLGLAHGSDAGRPLVARDHSRGRLREDCK